LGRSPQGDRILTRGLGNIDDKSWQESCRWSSACMCSHMSTVHHSACPCCVCDIACTFTRAHMLESHLDAMQPTTSKHTYHRVGSRYSIAKTMASAGGPHSGEVPSSERAAGATLGPHALAATPEVGGKCMAPRRCARKIRAASKRRAGVTPSRTRDACSVRQRQGASWI